MVVRQEGSLVRLARAERCTGRQHRCIFGDSRARVGGASLKEAEVSSGGYPGFSSCLNWQGTYPLRRSPQLRFRRSGHCLSLARWRPFRQVRRSIAHGLFSESGRSRSCPGDCTSTHPFVRPLALRLALRQSDLGRPGTVLFSATILRSRARPNHTDVPLGLLPTDLCATSD